MDLLWEEYRRLQDRLATRDAVDDLSWGMEAGLNRVLDAEGSPDEVDRAVRTGSRKERRQQGLRYSRERIQDISYSAAMERRLDMRRRIKTAAAKLPKDQFALLRDVALGYDYDEIARRSAVSAGTLRTRMFRIRRALHDDKFVRAAS